jgi:transposase
MKGKPPRYSEEFRREAVRLVESGTPLKQVARDLGVDAVTLRGWRRQLGRPAAPPKSAGRVPLLEEENRRLRRENARLLEEREILKKATAFFAKDAR